MSYADIHLDDATRQCKCTCCIELVNAVDHHRSAAFMRCWCHNHRVEEQCACTRCVAELAAHVDDLVTYVADDKGVFRTADEQTAHDAKMIRDQAEFEDRCRLWGLR